MRHVKECGKFSGDGVWGYGYQWKVGELPIGKKRVFAAAGLGNQRVFVLPDDGLVVTVFAGEYRKPFKPNSEMILKRVLEARKSKPSGQR